MVAVTHRSGKALLDVDDLDRLTEGIARRSAQYRNRGTTMGFRSSERGVEWRHDAHRDETRAPGLVAACALTGVASVIIMALRFLSRRLLYGRLRLETSDWFLLTAWIFFVMVEIAWVVGAQSGIGRHAATIEDFHKIQIVSPILFMKFLSALSSSPTSSRIACMLCRYLCKLLLLGGALSNKQASS